jgi:isoleucyl-tRNA synthetase
MRYPSVDPQPKFPEVEERVLAFWERDRTFQASIDARPAGENGSNEFVFYDGPPFANGLPHYGHILTGYVKDAVPRYQTMRGHRVERRFGWDTHGLPAEVEAERLLGLSGRREIEDYGVAAFNDVCRTSVLEYTREWVRYVTRQARWVDFENDYKTLDLSYMESVMWAFKTLSDRGLVYEGYRVLAYCWRCETPLSNTETRMDDVYRDRQDPALTVWFQLDDGRRLLAWTTTPWTLPSNLALAVGPDIDYVEVEDSGDVYVLAAARVEAYRRELTDATIGRTIKGRDLVGHRYEPLFDFFADEPNAFQVIAADFVSTDEGTGVVHLAPGFGEDDQIACAEHGIGVVCPMDAAGRFTSEVVSWAGVHVFDANPEVTRALKERGRVVRHETYDHSYPHCWRCARPLVYRAVSSWFVEVTKFRDRMVELNQEIRWVPEHIRDGSFGKWLGHARDWSISRNRFWGSPIPVWKSDDARYPRIDVYGSLADLERDFGVRVTDLHRPAVDELVRPNPDDPTGQSMMRRVPEVLDCWFESGSMPYAQVHYPFDNSTWFEHHYPGDFIVEYIGQTRGWFYTLHVLATALFDRPSFKACMSHGIVLGTDGQKASKSLRNYVDPFEMFDTYGSDAVRWFLLSSPILRGADLIVNEQGIRDAANQVLRPLWNAWSFFTLYANAENYEARIRTDQQGVLDRYLLAKLHELVASVTARMDEYDLFAACASIRAFLDALTNWYIRRSRNRFWDGETDAFDTLYTALHVLTRVAAPLLPLVSEELYQGLTGERSVHLTDWPDADTLPADAELVATMDRVRDVCSAALSIRKARGLRVRLPLATLDVIASGAPALAPFRDLIKDEVNVKEVVLTEDVGDRAAYELKLVPALLGPRLGASMQDVMRAYKKGEYQLVPGRPPVVGGVELHDGEAEVRLVATDPESSATLPGGAGIVCLDTTLTAALQAEGQARDLVRIVQQARRDAGLHVSDRVNLTVRASASTVDVLAPFREFVAAEVLATATSWIVDDRLVTEVEVEVERA